MSMKEGTLCGERITSASNLSLSGVDIRLEPRRGGGDNEVIVTADGPSNASSKDASISGGGGWSLGRKGRLRVAEEITGEEDEEDIERKLGSFWKAMIGSPICVDGMTGSAKKDEEGGAILDGGGEVGVTAESEERSVG